MKAKTFTRESTTLSSVSRRRERAKLGSAVTGHRFGRLADSSVKQSRVKRLVEEWGRPHAIAGNKLPAKSTARSVHTKALCIGLVGTGIRWASPNSPNQLRRKN